MFRFISKKRNIELTLNAKMRFLDSKKHQKAL